jgi:hypothetical protein
MQELRNKAVESNSTGALRTLLGSLQDQKSGNRGLSGLDLEVKIHAYFKVYFHTESKTGK